MGGFQQHQTVLELHYRLIFLREETSTVMFVETEGRQVVLLVASSPRGCCCSEIDALVCAKNTLDNLLGDFSVFRHQLFAFRENPAGRAQQCWATCLHAVINGCWLHEAMVQLRRHRIHTIRQCVRFSRPRPAGGWVPWSNVLCLDRLH